ncbi:hypothetical protein KY289_016412 [Solanum tuberosum]|nr:hypothetical protein KY289_016412 [Solanum tuberosum]
MAMVSKEEFLHLFDRFVFLICQHDVKQRIVDVVNHKHIHNLVLLCLGKINMTYESDRDLMIRFYEFVAKEEMACEEAELGPDRFAERLTMQQNLQEQIHQELNKANFDTEASVLTVEQMQDAVRRRVSSLFQPR